MKLVVTGALGHIGSRLIRELPSAYPDAEFVLLDSLMTQRYGSLFHLPNGVCYRFVELDVSKADLAPHLADATAVVHLAAMTDAAYSHANSDEVERANLGATSRVADACAEAKCPMFHVSTTSVYGTDAGSVSENGPVSELRPQSPYAATKLSEERLLRDLGEARGLRFAICRFGTICGVSPGMRFHTAVNKFCWQAVMGRPLTVWTTALHQKRPYLDLADAVAAIEFVLKRNLFDRQVYNVVSENLTVSAIIEMIRARVADVAIELVESPIMNAYSYDVSDAKLRQLGFQIKGSVAACIAETIEILRMGRGDPGQRQQ